jgi:hypothetical protein
MKDAYVVIGGDSSALAEREILFSCPQQCEKDEALLFCISTILPTQHSTHT